MCFAPLAAVFPVFRFWFSVVCCETHGVRSDCQDNQGVRRVILKTGFGWILLVRVSVSGL